MANVTLINKVTPAGSVPPRRLFPDSGAGAHLSKSQSTTLRAARIGPQRRLSQPNTPNFEPAPQCGLPFGSPHAAFCEVPARTPILRRNPEPGGGWNASARTALLQARERSLRSYLDPSSAGYLELRSRAGRLGSTNCRPSGRAVACVERGIAPGNDNNRGDQTEAVSTGPHLAALGNSDRDPQR